jgi:adenylate kinase family enzyme
VDQTVPRRLKVVGNSGAGKTTLARRIADRLDVPHLELDEAFWGPDWEMVEPEVGRGIVGTFLAQPDAQRGWVIDGNWNNRLGDLLHDVEAIVWLDFPRRVVMRRVVTRSLGRAALRRKLWHGNRERLRNLVLRDPEDNIVLWAWTEHDAYRQRYADLAAAGDVRVIRLGSPRQARRWLVGLRTGLTRPTSD